MTKQHPDSGFTLIEVLLVIVILALLASVVVAAVDGITADAEETGCDAQRRVLTTAVEGFFALRAVEFIPATDTTDDRYENTLVAEGLIRQPSEHLNLTAAGDVVAPIGSPCA